MLVNRKLRVILLQIVGIASLFFFVRLTYLAEAKVDEEIELKSEMKGKKMSDLKLTSLTPKSLKTHISMKCDKKLYVLVSPNCIHCENLLKLIQSDINFIDQQMCVVALFKNLYQEPEINGFLDKNNIKIEAFKVVSPSFIDKFTSTPTLFYSKFNQLETVHVGGVSETQELRKLITSLSSSKRWQQEKDSTSSAACQ